MKKAIILASMVLSTTAFANCEDKARQAAVNLEANGSKMEPGSFDSTSKRVTRTKTKLVYEVEVSSSYTDGATSYEFPSVVYKVTASGTEENCKITKVAIKK